MGRLSTNIGDSLIYLTFTWIIYRITRDSFYTGVASFLFSMPVVLGALWGPIIDRRDKKKSLIEFGILQIVIVVLLLLSIKLMGLNKWTILISIPFLTICSELIYPVQETLLPVIVSRSDLVKANSISEIANRGIDITFNAISAFLLAVLSFNKILVLVLLFFVLALKAFFSLNIRNTDYDLEEEESYFLQLKEGLQFIKDPFILTLLLPLIGINCLYAAFYVTLPEFVSVKFNSVVGYGLILTFVGIGNLIGSAISDRFSQKVSIGFLLVFSILIIGTCWISVTILPYNFLSVIFILLSISGICNGVINVIYATLFQFLPPKSMIGRVHTINMALIQSLAPLASILAGMITRELGSVITISVYGVCLIIIAIVLILNKKIRQIPKITDLDNS